VNLGVYSLYLCKLRLNKIFFIADASSLKEAEHVRDSQEKVVQALQQYTYSNYPSLPSKFAELLLRMPELHRVCQVLNKKYFIILKINFK
jgi:hypothetical protein